MTTVNQVVRPTKTATTRTRYTVTRAFDYLTAGRQYDVETRSNSRDADFRRTDGSGVGCYVPMWKFEQAIADGSLVPATPAPQPGLCKSAEKAVDIARLHLRSGNPGAYARSLAGEHRAANLRQQRAIEAVIAADGREQLFKRHPINGCLLAVEG